MIYKNGYFREELKKSHLDSGSGRRKLITVCFLVSLFSLVLNNFFVMMEDTVIGDSFSALCSRSFYSVITMMNVLTLIFFAFYFTKNYEANTFADISKNRWYVLVKSGYKTTYMIFVKQITTALVVLALYAGSFLLCFLLSYILRYTVSLTAILPLFIVGLIQLEVMILIIMTFSLFIKKKSSVILLALVYMLFIAIVSAVSGFTTATRSSAGMTLSKLFTGTTSVYMYVLLVCGVINLIVSVIIAQHKSKYYHTQRGKIENVVVIDYKTDEAKRIEASGANKISKLIKNVVMGAVIVLLIAGVLANVALIMMGTSDSTSGEFSVLGTKPYIFASYTMSDDIEYNDFVVFTSATEDLIYENGDIVIYNDGEENQIRKITSVNDNGTITVDISSYPSGATQGDYLTSIYTSEVDGVMTFRSRWLGAWFVFNNSMLGKIFTMLVPLLVIAFYNQLAKLIKYFVEKLG